MFNKDFLNITLVFSGILFIFISFLYVNHLNIHSTQFIFNNNIEKVVEIKTSNDEII